MREGMRESVPSAMMRTRLRARRQPADQLRAAFIGASVAWTSLLGLAPWLATRAHASTLGTGVVVAVYAVGHIVCHQLPARSFHLWRAQMPVCARCTGIYAGAALAAIAQGATALAVAPTGRLGTRAALALAALPTALTLIAEWTTGVAPSNWIRFAAGVPLGGVVAWLIVAASRNQVN